MNIKKSTLRRSDVSVKFVGCDLHLRVGKGSQLKFAAISKGNGVDSITISDGNLVLCNVRNIT